MVKERVKLTHAAFGVRVTPEGRAPFCHWFWHETTADEYLQHAQALFGRARRVTRTLEEAAAGKEGR